MIRIAVDSNAECKQGDKIIDTLVPIIVTVGEKEFLGGVNLENDDFYEMLINGKDFPSTAQPAPTTFTDLYEDCRDKGDDLILITIASALSGTYQSACMAKDMVGYDRIFVVDSMTATHPIWVLTKIAYDMREEGKTTEEIVAKLEEMRKKVKVVAAVDTLEFLHRGGRLSKAVATIGSIASLKPILTVKEDGTLGMIGKALGRGKAMQFVMNKLKETEIDTSYPIFSLYTYGTENCEALEAQMKEAGYDVADRRQIGPSVGAHVGPGAYGVVYVEK